MAFDEDLKLFFNPMDFGDTAQITVPMLGPISIEGIASIHAQTDRPGAAGGSTAGAFLMGVADTTLQSIQFLTEWRIVYEGATELQMLIETGKYSGNWRVRYIEQDGDIARMFLNKL